MNLKSKIYLLRGIHIVGALFLYFSIGVLIYSGLTKTHPPIFPYAFTALSLEAVMIVFNKWDCPLHPIHKKLGDKKAFFGLFLPEQHTRKAMVFSIIIGLFSFIFYFSIKLIN